MPVNIQNSKVQGIYKELMHTWKNQYPLFEDQFKLFFKELGYDKAQVSSYAWKEALPFPKKYEFNRGRQHQEIKDVRLDVKVSPYELTIDARRDDIFFDQMKDLKAHLEYGVKRMLQIPHKQATEFLTGVADINPDLPVSTDGAALYSTVNGDSENRYGVSGGNIVTGSGATTTAAVSDDIFEAQERAMQFLDPASELIYDEDDVKFSNLHLMFPPQMTKVAQKIAKSGFLRTDTSNTVSEDNIMYGELTYHINPRLTDATDWYVFIDHPVWKPFVKRQQTDIEAIWADITNSDIAREKDLEMLYSKWYCGTAVWCPFTTIKINN